MMRLAVTIKRDDDLTDLKALIEGVRRALTESNVTILEAPTDFNYPYPFPVVTISDGPDQGRHFGAEALELLREISTRRYVVR